jgi:hypothetical protein
VGRFVGESSGAPIRLKNASVATTNVTKLPKVGWLALRFYRRPERSHCFRLSLFRQSSLAAVALSSPDEIRSFWNKRKILWLQINIDKALNPFFDVVMKGLNGLVDAEHYCDAIAEDAQFEFLYRFPGWAEVIHGRENLIAAYSGYGNNIVLEKGDGLAVHHDKERGVVTLEY